MFGSLEKEAAVAYIGGRALRCQICENDRFYQRKAQLNNAVTTFFSLDWLDPAAVCFICGRCGYVHWFLSKKES